MKTIMKKSLCLLIGLFILFSFNCYAGETLTAQQKEAEEWFEKANNADILRFKIEYYTKAIEIDPKYADAYYNRGTAYISSHEYQRAIEDYSKMIEFDPENPFIYLKHANIYFNLGEYQKAIDEFTKVIDDNRKEIIIRPFRCIHYVDDAYYVRGRSYVLQGFPTAACGDFYQAGLLFLKQNNTTEALKCVDLMKKTDPSSTLINKLMDKIYK